MAVCSGGEEGEMKGQDDNSLHKCGLPTGLCPFQFGQAKPGFLPLLAARNEAEAVQAELGWKARNKAAS